jgi:hypothetical protein
MRQFLHPAGVDGWVQRDTQQLPGRGCGCLLQCICQHHQQQLGLQPCIQVGTTSKQLTAYSAMPAAAPCKCVPSTVDTLEQTVCQTHACSLPGGNDFHALLCMHADVATTGSRLQVPAGTSWCLISKCHTMAGGALHNSASCRCCCPAALPAVDVVEACTPTTLPGCALCLVRSNQTLRRKAGQYVQRMQPR